MTIILSMRLGKQKGIMLTDRCASFSNGLSGDIIAKSRIYSSDKVSALVGECGVASTTFGVFDDFSKIAKESNFKTRLEFAQAFGKTAVQFKRRWIEGYLEAEGADGLHVRGRQVPAGDYLMNKYKQCIDYKDSIVKTTFGDSLFQALVRDDEDVSIYNIKFFNSEPYIVSHTFDAIGCGNIIAEKSLFTDIERIPNERRSEIPIVDGMIFAFRAYNQSKRVSGVGRVPLGYCINGNKILPFGQNASLLASHLVAAYDERILQGKKVKKSLNDILNGQDWNAVYQDIQKSAGKKQNALNQFLLGFT